MVKQLRTIGTISEVIECRNAFPQANIGDIDAILNGRRFMRWYKKNAKVINALALITPGFAMRMFGIAPGYLALKLFEGANVSAAVHAFGTVNYTIPAFPSVLGASTVPTSFFGGKGAILLHMLVAGFFTLVVSSFLKFTGRGDIIPLVAFVGGGIILYECIGLFSDIYSSIKTLMSM